MVRLDSSAGSLVLDVRRFARSAVLDHLRVHGEEAYPADLVARMRDVGVFGMSIPRESGGAGLSAWDTAQVIYELARAWQPLAGLVGTHAKLCAQVVRHGTAEQRDTLLPAMAAGRIVCARAYHERGRNDPELLDSRIAYRGGVGVLNGHKDWVTNARHADRIVAIARGTHGTRAVVVDPSRPGVRVGDELRRPGMRGVSLAAVDFVDYEFDPGRDVLGGPAHDVTDSTRDHDMTGYVSRALGSADAVLAWMSRFVAESAGGFPEQARGVIGLRVGQATTRVSALRAVWRDLFDPSPVISADEAKVFGSAVVQEVTGTAIGLCGGAGYAGEDTTLTRHYRDAVALQIIGAPNDALSSRIGNNEISAISSGETWNSFEKTGVSFSGTRAGSTAST